MSYLSEISCSQYTTITSTLLRLKITKEKYSKFFAKIGPKIYIHKIGKITKFSIYNLSFSFFVALDKLFYIEKL